MTADLQELKETVLRELSSHIDGGAAAGDTFRTLLIHARAGWQREALDAFIERLASGETEISSSGGPPNTGMTKPLGNRLAEIR